MSELKLRPPGSIYELTSGESSKATQLVGAELGGADGVGEDEECGGEGDVGESVRNGVRAAGRAGEIEAGRVIHRADVPDGGEESFEGLACAAQCAESEGESGKKKRACRSMRRGRWNCERGAALRQRQRR